MAMFGKLFSGGEKVRKPSCDQEEIEKLQEKEELLMKKKGFLKKKIDDELLFAKKNCRQNRRGALQALSRKKWYEKHLKYIDCAVKAMKSAHENINVKVNDLIMDTTEGPDLTQDISDSLHTSVSFGVEFDKDELLAELKRLEENLIEEDETEENVFCPKLSSTASAPQPAKTEEDEIEDDLEYLRRWAIGPSQTHHHP